MQYIDILFTVLERYSKALNPSFGCDIAWCLAHSDPVPDGDIMSRWVPIVLQNKPLVNPFVFTEVLKRSLKQGALAATAQLFEYLTRPHLVLRKRISLYEEESDKGSKTDVELDFYGDYHLLSELWEKNIKPKLPELSPYLWPAVINNLNRAYQLSSSWGKAGPTGDPMSWRRSGIEPHDQDKNPHAEDVLINAARDCLEWALENVPQLGHAWMESLCVLESPILRRLALHGVSFAPHLSPNAKIGWILEKDFLFALGFKHELFQLLKNAYPGADPDMRKHLLETTTKKIDAFPEKEEGDKVWKEYQKFNLLYWLSQAAPDCQEVAARLVLIRGKYPNFLPRQHPDLDHWFSGASWVGPRSPVSVEDLLKKRPGEWLEYFVTFKGERFEGPDRNGLLQIISEAVKQDFNWGKDLTGLLTDQVSPMSDLWESVIRGWSGTNLSGEQWEYTLSMLNDGRLAEQHSHYISDLLQHGAEKEEDGIPVRLLDKADSVAQKVWATLKDDGDAEPNDWLGRAINHPGGKLAMFWLHVLSRTRKEGEQKEPGLLQPQRERFETIVSGTNETATLGRVMLASQLAFLFAVDQDWAKKNVIPLLDWDRDIQQARQAWDGWLSWGRLSEPLLDELIPLYKKSFPHISSDLQRERSRFVEWVVVISLFWMDDPLENKWVPDFLQAAEEQDRINFASQVGNQLMSMKDETKSGLWQRWLKKYWEDRNRGTPVPLSDGELKEMAEWGGELEPVFPEAVELICKGRVPHFEHTSLFWRLEKEDTNISTRYPEDLAKLLVHLTKDIHMPRYFCGELENLTQKIITAGVPATILRRLCDNLAAIGCVRAVELSCKIE